MTPTLVATFKAVCDAPMLGTPFIGDILNISGRSADGEFARFSLYRWHASAFDSTGALAA